MRSDVRRLLDEIAAMRADHAEERAEWREERTMLLNAALSSTPTEFAQRQNATEPRVVYEPKEREPRSQIIGM